MGNDLDERKKYLLPLSSAAEDDFAFYIRHASADWMSQQKSAYSIGSPSSIQFLMSVYSNYIYFWPQRHSGVQNAESLTSG
jgi:hypothetical protein